MPHPFTNPPVEHPHIIRSRIQITRTKVLIMQFCPFSY